MRPPRTRPPLPRPPIGGPRPMPPRPTPQPGNGGSGNGSNPYGHVPPEIFGGQPTPNQPTPDKPIIPKVNPKIAVLEKKIKEIELSLSTSLLDNTALKTLVDKTKIAIDRLKKEKESLEKTHKVLLNDLLTENKTAQSRYAVSQHSDNPGEMGARSL